MSIEGRLAGLAGRACNPWSQGHEFKFHIGRGGYLKKQNSVYRALRSKESSKNNCIHPFCGPSSRFHCQPSQESSSSTGSLGLSRSALSPGCLGERPGDSLPSQSRSRVSQTPAAPVRPALQLLLPSPVSAWKRLGNVCLGQSQRVREVKRLGTALLLGVAPPPHCRPDPQNPTRAHLDGRRVRGSTPCVSGAPATLDSPTCEMGIMMIAPIHGL